MKAKQQLQPASVRKVWVDFGASYTLQMGVDEWIAVPDHPRQRDTARQARKAHWSTTAAAQGPAFESLRFVVAGEFEGAVFKVDGHARAFLWDRGELLPPSFVVATVFRCKTREEFNELYTTHHAPLASHTESDRIAGAYREQGLNLTSERLRPGHIAAVLGIAWRAVHGSEETIGDVDPYEAVALFATELQLLDSLNPRNRVFQSGLVAAALLALAADRRNVEFFRRVAAGLGEKKEGMFDPVEQVLEATRTPKKRKSTVREHQQQEDLCWQTLHALQTWQAGPEAAGFWSKALPRPLDGARRDELISPLKQSKKIAPVSAGV